MPTINQRPEVPEIHANEKEHRRLLAKRANVGFPIDGTKPMLAPATLKDYTVATLPTASLYQWGMIVVSDEAGGSIPAFSDGTNWRRLTDRAIVT